MRRGHPEAKGLTPTPTLTLQGLPWPHPPSRAHLPHSACSHSGQAPSAASPSAAACPGPCRCPLSGSEWPGPAGPAAAGVAAARRPPGARPHPPCTAGCRSAGAPPCPQGAGGLPRRAPGTGLALGSCGPATRPLSLRSVGSAPLLRGSPSTPCGTSTPKSSAAEERVTNVDLFPQRGPGRAGGRSSRGGEVGGCGGLPLVRGSRGGGCPGVARTPGPSPSLRAADPPSRAGVSASRLRDASMGGYKDSHLCSF